MSELQPIKPKSFWQRPEGITGGLFMAAILIGGGFLLYQALPVLITLASNMLYLAGMLAALGAIIYMILDPKVRNLVWYAYKGVMRWLTGLFVQIDPIGILKTYIETLQKNLRNMNQQIVNLLGQMRKLRGTIEQNERDIRQAMGMASQAQKQNIPSQVTINTRKAGRLQESNARLEELWKRMEILSKLLSKMYENSEVMLEDLTDQVKVKEQEYKMIKASHSALRSAMSIISGNGDERYMYDMALEAMAEEVGQKVGEMERFMDTSKNFMANADLQNGVFEEEGLKLLQQWEQKGSGLFVSGKLETAKTLDLNTRPKQTIELPANGGNTYDNLFER